MDNRPVLYYDSGIGGLYYGYCFSLKNPHEKTICLGDRANFPYGMKSKEELIELTISVTKKIIALFNPKIMALACNTASVSALNELREAYPDLPIVGTVPAIKPAAAASKKRCIGVLATKRTISDSYISELVKQYGPDCRTESIAAPELPEFLEHRWADAGKTEKYETAKYYIEKFRERGADTLVLACTHFPLMREEFEAAAGDEIKIFDSVEGIRTRIESLLDADNGRLRHDSNTVQKALMAVTGESDPEPYWKKITSRFGFELIKA